jgi:hypothetical protein
MCVRCACTVRALCDEIVAAAKDAGALRMRYRNVYEAGRDFEFRRAKLRQSGQYRRCSQCAAQNNELIIDRDDQVRGSARRVHARSAAK